MGAMLLVTVFIFFGCIIDSNQSILANPTNCDVSQVSAKGKVFDGKSIITSMPFDQLNTSTIHACHHVCQYNCNCNSVVFYGLNSSTFENCYLFNLYNITQYLTEYQSASVTYFGHPKDCFMASKDDCGKETKIYGLGLHNNRVPIKALCDMDTDGGGWTFLQKRFDGSVDFYLDWYSYKHGFGDMNGEFWLGLDTTHEMMKNGNTTLRFDLWDGDNNHRYAEYYEATISDETDNYRLNFNGYSGNASDSLATHENKKFSTYDKDNDDKNTNCAFTFTGAWWYSSCHTSNLNGRYGDFTRGKGLNWREWKGLDYSLSRTEIKFRRNE